MPRPPRPTSATPPSSVIIENIQPQVDGGRYPVKREVGDVLRVTADIFKDGHDHLAAMLKYRTRGARAWREVPMVHLGNDAWEASFPLEENTRYQYTIEAFPDRFDTWADGARKKADAGQDVLLEVREAVILLEEALTRAKNADRSVLEQAIGIAGSDAGQAAKLHILLGQAVHDAMLRCRSRAGGRTHEPALEVTVDRVKARFAAWYEFFPRSAGTDPTRGATFREARDRLPAIREMGFDTVYLPPIHPIGQTFRKGKNNSVTSKPGEPGVPYAIGSHEGGHDAVEPGLGTMEDFRVFRERCEDLGMEVVLDFAVQASPDHPWVKEHRAWFTVRPDGTIQYAENPPKKYQDIYPINFDSTDWTGLWDELLRVVRFWVEQGVKVFRVDNPHTKPTTFWEWLIGEIQETNPEVIFLSEAFTRPKVMKALAKAGFTQSYTYFTWRNFKQELIDYFTELTQQEPREYMRGNLFPNTPDILPVILQEGGRPAFRLRLCLAATLSSVYGIYSGFELCENAAIPGKEEYLNSEKYEIKPRDWNAPGNIIEDVTRINRIRQEHPALHEYDNLRFFPTDNDNLLCYGKATPDRSDFILVVVNLDPYQTREGHIDLPIGEWGIGWHDPYRIHDLTFDETHLWTTGHIWLRLDPQESPYRIYHIEPWPFVEFEDPSLG
jgi:starch synthase (maltosyl-transferring)